MLFVDFFLTFSFNRLLTKIMNKDNNKKSSNLGLILILFHSRYVNTELGMYALTLRTKSRCYWQKNARYFEFMVDMTLFSLLEICEQNKNVCMIQTLRHTLIAH